ncbi:MAG: glutathione binding-like protein [Alphaproteobacteria bacterium]|nr:glutathione binding-like protein [Alphaproteobacteria bacterium]
MAGKNFSIADITAFCAISFAERLKFEIPEEAINLRRWLESVSSRPSALV